MLRPPGFLTTELGDIEVLVHGGRIHVFHLCLPNHDRIAHWVSDDGIEWEARPDALRTGDPGSFDDDQLWTMSVTRHREGFVMLYTALSRAEQGSVQRVGRATSDDLERWTKDPQPVAVAEGEHYETTAGRSAAWVSFRDPKPLALGKGYAVVVAAQVPDGPPYRRGTVAVLHSADLETFTLQPPLHTPRRAFELECPQLIATPQGMVLMASLQDDRSVRWFHADGLQGPFRTPSRSRLLPDPYYAARVFEDDEGFAIAGTYRYHDRHGRLHHVMPTPLRLDVSQPGRIVLRPWEATRRRFGSDLRPLRFETPRFHNPTTEGLGVQAGEELWTAPASTTDGLLQGRLVCDGPRFGVAFDVQSDGAAWFVELEPAEGRARLVRRGPSTDARGMPWFEHYVAQSVAWHTSCERGLELGLTLLGPQVQVCIDGAVVLSAVVDRTDEPLPVGIWVDSGQMSVDLGMLARAPSFGG